MAYCDSSLAAEIRKHYGDAHDASVVIMKQRGGYALFPSIEKTNEAIRTLKFKKRQMSRLLDKISLSDDLSEKEKTIVLERSKILLNNVVDWTNIALEGDYILK